MWCLRGENPVSQVAVIEGGCMDGGSDDEVLEIALLTVLLSWRQKRRRLKRTMWVRSILSQRWQRGEYHTLLQEMRLNDTQAHFSYLRMLRERFEHLLAIVGPLLVRRENYWSAIRANITPAERLALTIRYLATGNSPGSTFFNYKGIHLVVLMAACDAHYRFILIDVGDTGRHSDGGVLSNSSFGQALVNGTLPLPKESPLPRISSPNLPCWRWSVSPEEKFTLPFPWEEIRWIAFYFQL